MNTLQELCYCKG